MASKNLIIVESPAKVKTIRKYLGPSYTIDASQGHVRDLPKSRLGVDVDHDFDPDYITIRGKGDLLAQLRKEAKQADRIYLATDPDREGEAISWHLLHALNLDDNKKVYRISFNEITKNAVREALKHPRRIDMNLVNAQQARRVLDRIVGYKISPILWEKIKRGLSAGRVQSVALKMICDREDEINAFIPQEYWTLDAHLCKKNLKKGFKASFYGTASAKIEIGSKEECDRIMAALDGAQYVVQELSVADKYRRAPLPFTTSTLQQEAGKLLNFSTQKTMSLAQQLYEGVSIPGRGSVALITYLRTDSTRVADEADRSAKDYLAAHFGNDYVGAAAQKPAQGGNIQDAHEAIRPTDIALEPAALKDSLPRDLFRLYQLIWKRFTASRMKAALYETRSAKIAAGSHLFTVSGSKLVFPGFLSVYSQEEEKNGADTFVDNLTEGEVLDLKELIPAQHFTQAPPRYTEPSLVRALEEQGIGRPSTYAPTISTIMGRHYVTKEQKNLYSTELGQVVNSMMSEQFPDVVDETFTASMEQKLDDVAEGRQDWKEIIRDFYPSFVTELEKAQKELENVKIADEVSDVVCENCGRNMVIKYGPHGRFLACPGFPECRNTKPLLEKTGAVCPKCGADIVRRKSRKGRVFYSCERSPECDWMSWQKPAAPKETKD